MDSARRSTALIRAMRAFRFLLLAVCVAWASSGAALAQAPSIKNGCGGALSGPMASIAMPYQRAVAALQGTEVGWCAAASDHDAGTPERAAMWKFVSAAYLLHALAGRKELTRDQETAVQRVLASIPGNGKPPAKLRDIDTAMYIHARTLAAEDGGAAQIALDGLQQHAPPVYRSLMRLSSRWGDAGDN
ncbi:hypothetical protein [Acidovorax sp.]|uniref:hypothetical protein n=1 Tax=Acidovorax sp. TaxID=1872122 RepID=UPI00391FAE30